MKRRILDALMAVAVTASVGSTVAPAVADASADHRESPRIHLEVCAEDGSVGSLC
jgi:hypothetical protein